MTIIEAISKTDQLIPNKYSQPDKIRWLSNLDGNVKNQVIDTHEGAGELNFTGYNDDTSLDTVLLIPYPFEDVYIHYLESCIHYENEEYAKYNVAATRYNTEYARYVNDYNKKHMPKGSKRFVF